MPLLVIDHPSHLPFVAKLSTCLKAFCLDKKILLLTGGDEQVYGSADLVNILARILDSERNFSGSADPMITADRGFIQFLGPDFGC